MEDIAELVRYAHVYNVRIYVTVNTILKDEELKDTEKNDLGFIPCRSGCFDRAGYGIVGIESAPIPLHASTQMDNRTPQKVRSWLRQVSVRWYWLVNFLLLK